MVKWFNHLPTHVAHEGFSEMAFGIIERRVLSEGIVARLLSLIKQKELRAGDKLPPERELADMMGVSRPSLREALRALSMMNVVEIRQGTGTYVTSLEPGLLVEHLDFVFSLDDSTFVKLFEARKLLEVGMVAMAAQRITDEEIAGLEACLAKSIESVEDHEAFLQADLELHEKITEAARNPILARMMATTIRLGLASRRRTVEIAGVPEQALRDHRAIVIALKARNPEAARQVMLTHLDNLEQQLKRLTSSEGLVPSARKTAVGEPQTAP